MKKYLIFLLILCLALVGCNRKDKDEPFGGFDIKGDIIEVDEKENRILIEDEDKGLIWISLNDNGNIKRYEEGENVVVWIDGGIDTSSPASAKALNIEFTTPKDLYN
ncbi:DUF3221 domain-containing protein [Viridibacillus sp. YIM B01967]|uniref:DUF3221 domain-containing protein n=1 Tax=Viridibacillus soli TaxID=2798301 RepID=A0ABS1H7P0_9BACL|nr:DUF3221 domain-containing protein [Viridibacillus soli]MBK3495314.1 DUF3221 domain-containing protein [Viridibacillus soli]